MVEYNSCTARAEFRGEPHYRSVRLLCKQHCQLYYLWKTLPNDARNTLSNFLASGNGNKIKSTTGLASGTNNTNTLHRLLKH